MGCLSTELGRAIPPATTYDIVMARHSAEAGGKSFPVPLKLLVGTRGELLMLGSGSAAVQQCSSAAVCVEGLSHWSVPSGWTRPLATERECG
ncbi:hypothetical protein V8F44DRAFT_599138, partial [Aspergillus fumigatus]